VQCKLIDAVFTCSFRIHDWSRYRQNTPIECSVRSHFLLISPAERCDPRHSACFVPNPHGPYLLHKPIARSYYQICSLMIRTGWGSLPLEYELSTTEYENGFESKTPLVQGAECLLRFFMRQKNDGLVFRNYNSKHMGMDRRSDFFLFFCFIVLVWIAFLSIYSSHLFLTLQMICLASTLPSSLSATHGLVATRSLPWRSSPSGSPTCCNQVHVLLLLLLCCCCCYYYCCCY
jgi:hypothetical protein